MSHAQERRQKIFQGGGSTCIFHQIWASNLKNWASRPVCMVKIRKFRRPGGGAPSCLSLPASLCLHYVFNSEAVWNAGEFVLLRQLDMLFTWGQAGQAHNFSGIGERVIEMWTFLEHQCHWNFLTKPCLEVFICLKNTTRCKSVLL